jgi:fimbrial chaperone protein
VLKAGIAFALSMFVSASALAGTFSIAPVRVELTAAKRTEVLTLKNQENAPVVIQARLYSWSQVDGEDLLVETRDLLATPPVFTLSPEGEQVIRVAVRSADASADAHRERSYRLVLQEVLPEAPNGFTGLRVALKISLPIFIKPSQPAKSEVAWHARRHAEGIEISARNDGTAHLQITDFTLESARGNKARQSVSRYVLPGSRVTWQLPSTAWDADTMALKLHAFTDEGEVSKEITLLEH